MPSPIMFDIHIIQLQVGERERERAVCPHLPQKDNEYISTHSYTPTLGTLLTWEQEVVLLFNHLEGKGKSVIQQTRPVPCEP